MRITAAIVAIGLIAWFFIAWLWLGQNVIDAAGESIGSALVILLAVSIVGVARQHRARKRGEVDTPPRT